MTARIPQTAPWKIMAPVWLMRVVFCGIVEQNKGNDII